MLQRKNLQLDSISGTNLAISMLVGALVALAFISLFLISAGDGNPAWPALWFVRPLVIVPISGAMGGAFHYYMHHLKIEHTGMKVLAIIGALLGYFVIVWMGIVLGLDGTWWD